MGLNPLKGPNIAELGPRFPDMTHAYDPDLRSLFYEAAKSMDYNLKEGVYCAVLGPTYETPAEIKMMGIMGADMVGMSTVPESIAANHLGLRVAGISCITNMAAGISHNKLNHDEVKEEAKKVMNTFSDLLSNAISKMK
jgi:purine-nucleoside phosphorylase